MAVKAWAILQREHYHTISSPRSEDKWAAAFVTNLWKIYFSSWTHRNEAFHQSEEKKDLIYNIHEINYEIRQQWCLGTHDLHVADKKHFQTSIAQLLHKNRQYKLTWLQRVDTARKAKHITKNSKKPS